MRAQIYAMFPVGRGMLRVIIKDSLRACTLLQCL